MQSSLKDFEILRKLGDGSFSQVFQVLRKSDSQIYAMKKVKMNSLKSKEKDNAVNEVRILASIENINIIHYKEAFYDENSNCLCIIMEYAPGGTLSSKIDAYKRMNQRIEEEVIWNYIYQMLKGLKALHELDIMHRDLKSANIFLSKDQKTLKIADMNVSKVAKCGLLYTQTGTPYYASPEIWRDEAYNSKSDIWSLGCVIYELCCHRPPFISNDMHDLYSKIQRGQFQKLPSVYSNELQEFVEKCLNKFSSKRPNCDGLLKFIILIRKNKNDENKENNNKGNNVLLKTIKVPKNLKCLGDVLPKPNYEKNKNNNTNTNNNENINKSDRDLSFPKLEHKNIKKYINEKENISKNILPQKQIHSVKHVKMPRIELRSKSPSIFKV